jgi:acyl-CoA synthetase (AMP-forming)/AMP-acid ligase II
MATVTPATPGVPLLEKLNNYGQGGKNRNILGAEVQHLVSGYVNIADLMPSTADNAVLEPLGAHRNALTHKRFRTFIEKEFDLEPMGIRPGARVGIILPNGPEMAVALFGVMSKWTAAPVNITNTWQEMKAELQSTKVVAIVILSGAVGNEEAIRAAEELCLGIVTLTSTGTFSGLFHMKLLQPVGVTAAAADTEAVVNIHTTGRFRTVLLLHTSGTSGTKKLVPYTLETLVVGVGCIVSSWGLQPTDICLNMMPLFHIGTPVCGMSATALFDVLPLLTLEVYARTHVLLDMCCAGGIVRNVLAPLLAGGSVVCCGGFDPLLFWDTLTAHRVTWYYASPAMHQAILQEAANRWVTRFVEGVSICRSHLLVGM